MMDKIMPKHQELIDSMFGSLNNDEAETIVKLLKKVSKKVELKFFRYNISKSR